MGAELVASALTISIGIVRPFARKFAFESCLLGNQESTSKPEKHRQFGLRTLENVQWEGDGL